jgi:hypothetical protein
VNIDDEVISVKALVFSGDLLQRLAKSGRHRKEQLNARLLAFTKRISAQTTARLSEMTGVPSLGRNTGQVLGKCLPTPVALKAAAAKVQQRAFAPNRQVSDTSLFLIMNLGQHRFTIHFRGFVSLFFLNNI